MHNIIWIWHLIMVESIVLIWFNLKIQAIVRHWSWRGDDDGSEEINLISL